DVIAVETAKIEIPDKEYSSNTTITDIPISDDDGSNTEFNQSKNPDKQIDQGIETHEKEEAVIPLSEDEESDDGNRVSSESSRADGLAIAGFVVGIVGWFLPFALGIPMCILAIVFGGVSLARIKNNPDK